MIKTTLGLKHHSKYFDRLIDAIDWSYENLDESIVNVEYTSPKNLRKFRCEWVGEASSELLHVDMIVKRMAELGWNKWNLRTNAHVGHRAVEKIIYDGGSTVKEISFKKICEALDLDYLQIKDFKDHNVRTGIAELNQS